MCGHWPPLELAGDLQAYADLEYPHRDTRGYGFNEHSTRAASEIIYMQKTIAFEIEALTIK